MAKKITVGVLALQGGFTKHVEMLRSIGVHPIEVRNATELRECRGLIIPGGESTTIFKQLYAVNLVADLEAFGREKPIFGTCAGLILMSKKIVNDPMKPFGFLDIEVERNAYGRQADSFQTSVDVRLQSFKKIPAVFIRAPRIRAYSTKVVILGEYEGGPILVQQGLHLGATFHPELTQDTAIHQYFLSKLK